jgi:predicted O-linked N-acetylglucosamine transferase (SPINDLY family)
VEILGVPELIADSDVAYLQIAQGLLRDAEARQRASDLVASRFQSEFASALLGRKYLDFVSSISSH